MADEKQRTEDLLSGFDRPGRTPRTAPVRRHDFVAPYVADPHLRRNEPTALITRARQGGWLPWLAVAFVGSALVGVVAWLALASPAKPPPAAAPSAPDSAPTSAPFVSAAAPASAPSALPPAVASTPPAPATAKPHAPAAHPTAADSATRRDYIQNL